MSSISVAMAVYNGERFLRKQLDSIIEQLHNDDEIVISYDASSDDTWSIIKEYESKYDFIHVLINNDPGVFGNFENAIRNCKKDYIFISDQDDIWHPEKRACVVKCFKQTGADMVIHDGCHINSRGEVVSESFFDMYRIKKGLLRNFAKPRYSGCCTAFTRQMKNIILPMPKSVGAYDHWLGMAGEMYGKLVFLDEKLLYHRLHGENVTPVSRRGMKIILPARMNLAKNLLMRKAKCRDWRTA